MSVAKVTFVLAFVLSCVIALDVSLDVSLKKDSPFVASFTPDNIFGDVTIEIEGNFDKTLVLCLQEMTNVPFRTKYATCTESIELNPSGPVTTGVSTGASTGVSTGASTSGDSTTGAGSYFARRSAYGGSRRVSVSGKTYTVSLRNTLYNVGVYFKAEPMADDNQQFKLKLTGTSCPEGKTGATCEDTLLTFPEKESQFDAGKKYYYTVEVPASSNTFTITAGADFTMEARFGAAPFGDNFDYSVDGKELTLLSPSVGTWYIMITPATSVATTLTGKSNQCTDNKVGNDCKSDLSALEGESPFITIKAPEEGSVHYYSVAGSVDSLLISARTTTKNDNQPKLFAGFERVPFFKDNNAVSGTYDISGCNVETCSVLNQIDLRTDRSSLTDTNGTWYIAVQATSTNEVIVWSNTICPNNCGGNGDCHTSGSDYGVCDCKTGHTGLLCTNDFTVEYVILIVIISLVAISAVIGLIAWAYMKSKHKGYEPV